MIETSSDLPRKSSVIFGYLWTSSVIFGKFRKMFGNVRVAFGQLLENLRKSSESGLKSSENRQKHRYWYVYVLWGSYIKRKLHDRLEIRNFSSHVKKYFTRSLRSIVNIFQHSKRNFVSPRDHIISSTQYIL